MVKIAENEEGAFVWHHETELQGRIGIISNERTSGIIKELKKKFRYMNEVNYHITTDNRKIEGAQSELLSIFQFEEFPSEGENSQFAVDRMKWVQMYFTLLAAIHKKERLEFIPLASFRAHTEGPLIGYHRAIVEMEDQENKELLELHLQKLEKVNWSVSDEEGFVYTIEGETDEELLESLFIGAWAFWLYSAFIVDTRPINLFIELDGLIVDFPVLNDKRNVITFVVDALARLTFNIQMSLTVKSPTLFPMPESLVEHIIIQNAETKDMQWNELTDFPAFVEGEEIIWQHQQIFRKMKLALADEKVL